MKPFTALAAVVFALLATVHLLRFIQSWPVSINGIALPVWLSAVAFVLTALLSVMLWRESRR